VIVFGVTGRLGGASSTQVIKELDDNIPEDEIKYIIKRSQLGFVVGGIVGGVVTMNGVFTGLLRATHLLDSDWSWALYIAVGFALRGAIGAAFTISALVRTINVDQP